MANNEPANGWVAYYKVLEGRPPRPLLLEALERWPAAATDDARNAIDLGCGDGTDTLALLQHGYRWLTRHGRHAPKFLLTNHEEDVSSYAQPFSHRFVEVCHVARCPALFRHP